MRGIALDLVRDDGSRLPGLVNSVVKPAEGGTPELVQTIIFDGTERRSYEQELLNSRRREHATAQALQRGLLSEKLPEADGLDLAASFRPAVADLEVGGDWYDAFWIENGRSVAMVVGDVAGKGLDAAIAMGQLRSAVRAFAISAPAPGQLLEDMDRFVRRHAVGPMTTLAYAEVALDSRMIRYACAGHPPPLVTDPGRAPELLWDGRSPPLDSSVRGERSRADAEVTLEADGGILLYTDGLIERRSQTLDQGLERLLREVGDRPLDAAARVTAALTRELRDPVISDDVCALYGRLGSP